MWYRSTSPGGNFRVPAVQLLSHKTRRLRVAVESPRASRSPRHPQRYHPALGAHRRGTALRSCRDTDTDGGRTAEPSASLSPNTQLWWGRRHRQQEGVAAERRPTDRHARSRAPSAPSAAGRGQATERGRLEHCARPAAGCPNATALPSRFPRGGRHRRCRGQVQTPSPPAAAHLLLARRGRRREVVRSPRPHRTPRPPLP